MNTAAEEIDEDINLLELGVSSIEAMQIINSIKEELQVDVSPAIILNIRPLANWHLFWPALPNKGRNLFLSGLKRGWKFNGKVRAKIC